MSGLELSWSSCYPHIFEHFIKVCHEEVNLCFNAANEMLNIWTREWGNIAKAMIKAYINTTINISSATTLTGFYLLNSTARVITITTTKQQSVMSGLSVCLVSHNLLYSGLKKAHLKQWNCNKKPIVWQLFFPSTYSIGHLTTLPHTMSGDLRVAWVDAWNNWQPRYLA